MLRCVFSSDPAVSSSIVVGGEREENLMWNDNNKSERFRRSLRACRLDNSCHLIVEKRTERLVKGEILLAVPVVAS